MLLRHSTEGDLPVFFRNQFDPEAARMAAFPSRGQEAFDEHWRTRILGQSGVCARTVVVDGVVAGHVVSWERDGMRLVGYWLGAPHWGRGIATAALREFVAAHDTTRPLHAYVAVSNVASARVLAKCGFRPAGEPTVAADGVEEVLVVLESGP
ncbi:MAG TPA: GNAT family protein [Polyangiaceae bacterium]